jgi:hypothetical protein|tara:strand:- start:164 stop:862 length:699 start_codon:yes stop_codon:yes gene_type:complete
MKLVRNLKEFIIDYLPYLYAIHDLIIKNKIFFSKKSYAHTEEDLFILKKFKNKKGFYVDVGCHHPTRLNNCHLLYKNGWNGINIDISEFTIKLFNLIRRKDININIAVSLKQKKVRFYYDKLISFYISLNKRKELDRFREINSNTLTKIIDKTKYQNRKIDFLSIDTEGKDFEVLRSLNFKKYDPKYICIEIYSDKNVSFNVKKNLIYKYLIKKNYKLLFNKRENYIFKKKL